MQKNIRKQMEIALFYSWKYELNWKKLPHFFLTLYCLYLLNPSKRAQGFQSYYCLYIFINSSNWKWDEDILVQELS